MAEASIFVKQEVTVTLTLNDEEAQVLTDILSRISGSTSDSRRALADNILRAFRSLGYQYNLVDGPHSDFIGQINFRSRED